MKIHARTIHPGSARGSALVSRAAISFFGGVDPDSGVVVEAGHPLHGKSIAGRVLVFPTGKGSTVGSYTLYRLKKNGKAPAAILNAQCETITAVGCIIADIPCLDGVALDEFVDGLFVMVDGDQGLIETGAPFCEG